MRETIAKRPDRERTRAIARAIGAAAGGHPVEDVIAALIMGLAWFAIDHAATPAEARELAGEWSDLLADTVGENFARQKSRSRPAKDATQ